MLEILRRTREEGRRTYIERKGLSGVYFAWNKLP
jgi:hypothetical protein